MDPHESNFWKAHTEWLEPEEDEPEFNEAAYEDEQYERWSDE